MLELGRRLKLKLRYDRFYPPSSGVVCLCADNGVDVGLLPARRPYRMAIAKMGENCRPFGRDSMALSIAYKGLATAAYHFTKVDGFYGARGDSTTPNRPLSW